MVVEVEPPVHISHLETDLACQDHQQNQKPQLVIVHGHVHDLVNICIIPLVLLKIVSRSMGFMLSIFSFSLRIF